MTKVLKKYVLPLFVLLFGIIGYINASSREEQVPHSFHNPFENYFLNTFRPGPHAVLPYARIAGLARKDSRRFYTEENEEETGRPDFFKKQSQVTSCMAVVHARTRAFLQKLTGSYTGFHLHLRIVKTHRYILLRVLRI